MQFPIRYRVKAKKRRPMSKKESHIEHHKLLHNHLDELIADMKKHKGHKLLSKVTVLELWAWSQGQTLKPTEE